MTGAASGGAVSKSTDLRHVPGAVNIPVKNTREDGLNARSTGGFKGGI